MKYKIGDKVLVRPDLEEGKTYGVEVVMSSMLFFRGKIVTIEHVDYPNCYRIKEDPDQWHWTDKMFSEKSSEEVKSEYLSYLEEIEEYFASNKIYNLIESSIHYAAEINNFYNNVKKNHINNYNGDESTKYIIDEADISLTRQTIKLKLNK